MEKMRGNSVTSVSADPSTAPTQITLSPVFPSEEVTQAPTLHQTPCPPSEDWRPAFEWMLVSRRPPPLCLVAGRGKALDTSLLDPVETHLVETDPVETDLVETDLVETDPSLDPVNGLVNKSFLSVRSQGRLCLGLSG
ncbi:hypothetical protein DPEC_G00081940 [Dallia pectoralis]|uniref:Uncharacterized protein n=1 Tax=Dallia pectoralis TaxID=75939 RepID=A0ACC2GYM1_DALPE|nr:hypothetical protein DPEC_G00081940 [Dallia pectoralis]